MNADDETFVPPLSAAAQDAVKPAGTGQLGPGQLVHSADRKHAGVVIAPPDNAGPPPPKAVGYVSWWPLSSWENRGWVTADEITTRSLPHGAGPEVRW